VLGESGNDFLDGGDFDLVPDLLLGGGGSDLFMIESIEEQLPCDFFVFDLDSILSIV
jgi:hypothetical protein